MKKKLILTLVAPVMCLSLIGCHSNVGMKLTYGTYLSTTDSDKNDAVRMSYVQLAAHMEEEGEFRNENFLLTIAPVNGCVCWTKFQGVLKQFIKETKYLVYQINCDEFGDNNYGLIFQDGHVSFAIIKGGTIIKQYMSHSILESTEALKAEVNKFVKAPELYYVDEPFLNEAIKNGETALVEYIRSGCSDCNYVSPNIIWPYAHQNVFKTKMYVIDIQDLYDTKDDSSDYQDFKNQYLLSETFDAEYGYGNGVVPTFQFYERGKIQSASVTFNDELGKVDGVLQVTKSFYTPERLQVLGYARNVKNNILQGLNIPDGDATEWNGHYFWNQSKAAEYHKPLLEAFLNTYTK